MSDMHACGFLPVMMRHRIPDSLTLARLSLVLSQTGFKPLFAPFFIRAMERSLSPKVNDLQKVNAACTTDHPPLGL